jgi:hypothetical protein
MAVLSQRGVSADPRRYSGLILFVRATHWPWGKSSREGVSEDAMHGSCRVASEA